MKIGKLSIKREDADTTFKKAKGLMFRKNLDRALVFWLDRESRLGASIHSYFVFFPFDIIWLDKNKQIVDTRTIPPFRLIQMPKKKAKYFIELPAGSIKKANVSIGQRINLD